MSSQPCLPKGQPAEGTPSWHLAQSPGREARQSHSKPAFQNRRFEFKAASSSANPGRPVRPAIPSVPFGIAIQHAAQNNNSHAYSQPLSECVQMGPFRGTPRHARGTPRHADPPGAAARSRHAAARAVFEPKLTLFQTCVLQCRSSNGLNVGLVLITGEVKRFAEILF